MIMYSYVVTNLRSARLVAIFRSVHSRATVNSGMLILQVYGTTWVGETFYRQDAAKAQELKSSTDAVGDIARKGSLALVLFSSISFAGSLFLPLIIDTPSSHDRHIPQQVRKLPCGRNLSITTALGLSQMAFAGAMILTPISRSFLLATALIAFCGM